MSDFVAKKLKDLRLKNGETQQQLADAIGVTAMAISKYENGLAVPSDDNKIKIARHYNESVEDIFFRPA